LYFGLFVLDLYWASSTDFSWASFFEPNQVYTSTRTEFKKLSWPGGFVVPPEYFFIHKQRAMDEDKSFIWNNVADGDIIEVFPGWISSE
ncbi:unnamed protein product, partial [Ilex paraguariensis]